MKGWTLVFDLDGTLVDTAPDLASATNHVLSKRGLTPVSEKEIRPFVGHGARAMIEGALKAHGCAPGREELDDLFEVFLSYYAANISRGSRPYPGLVTALETFAGAGAKLAVCTNKIEPHARLLLDELDLTQHFAAITGRESLGVSKPDPLHLTGTIALAKGDPQRAVMIGDSETDIATAKNARIPVIAVDFGYSTVPVRSLGPDAVISHFDELAPAFTRLALQRRP